MLPVLSDLPALLRRLAFDERDRLRKLASLEDRIRRFEDVERPAYEHWRRLTFGPALSALQELHDTLHARRALARQVMELVERRDLRPREALYVATHRDAAAAYEPTGPDPDEVEARRRAKRERKRAARKQALRERRPSNATPNGRAGAATDDAQRITTLYRALARRLHPDSSTAIRSLDAARVRTVWCEVQSAYEARSLERMLAMSAWLETVAAPAADEPPTAPLLSLAERHERLRALVRSCGALQRRLAQLERDPAWNFVDAPGRIRRQLEKDVARDIDDELCRVREMLDDLDEFFASIGSPRPPPGGRKR